jgi:hypothetical protein
MRIAKLMIAAAAVLVAVPAFAQVDTAAAQKKLLAKRAAEADAYRKLAEAIKGVQINSETYVRDFVAENDQIRAGLDNFIRGVRLGTPKYMSDGSCEVPGEVTLAKVVQEIKELHTRFYKGDCGRCVKAKDITEMQQRVEKQVIRVVGMGAPREDLPPDLPEGVARQLGGPPVPPEPPIPDLWKQIGPQGRMMAHRAAEVDAKRKLVERILGLRVNSETLVKDFVAESDVINTVTAGTLIGSTIVRTYYHSDEPICEVTVAVPLESVVSTIKELHTRTIHGDHVKGTDITEICNSIKTQTFEATGTGVPKQNVLQAYVAKVPQQQQFPPWAMAAVYATGQGVPPQDKAGTPQGKLLAARAAELDAKRKLAEQVYGLRIASNTTVKDFVAQHDDIRTQVDAILVGSSIEKTTFKEDGTAEVTVALPGMSIWEQVHGGMGMAEAAPRQ